MDDVPAMQLRKSRGGQCARNEEMPKTIIGDETQPARNPRADEQPRVRQKETARRNPSWGRRRCISLGCYTGAFLADRPSRSWASAGWPGVSGGGVGWAAGKGPGMSWPSRNRQDAALSRFC